MNRFLVFSSIMQFGATPKDIAILVTSTGLISVIIQLFAVDWVVRRFGEAGCFDYISLALQQLGFLLCIIAPSYVMFFGVTMIIFLSTSILRPVLTTLISKLAGKEQGFAMGMNNAYMSIGNVLGPLLAGLLYDVHIFYPFILGLIVLVITMFVSMKWKGSSQTIL